MSQSGNYKLRKKIDPIIPIIGFGLSVLGLVMVLSASQITAADKYADAYHFFIRQLIAFGIGLVGFFYFLRLPLERLYERRASFLWATLILLILVFLPGIGGETAGVYRWVGFGGFSFQPSEVAKLFLVIYFSAWFASKGDAVSSVQKGFIPFLLLLAMIALLVGALGRDLDTAVVLLVSAVVIFFVAKAKVWQVGAITLLAIGAVLLLIFATPYRLNRLQSYQDQRQNNAEFYSQNRGYHSQQALIAVGSGGLWGVGFGQGTSKYSYLPEAHTDSIFAVIAEELGFIRAAALLLAYVLLAWRGLVIAQRANSRFVCYLAVGISTLIILQTLINIGGMLALLPLAGIPLPFVSYGGTSLIVSLAMLGVLTNASRETK